MVIGSKWQLKSLNLDDFTISVDSDKLFLASQAKYLGLWVRNDLSWDDNILELCRKIYYYFHMFRRLRKILPSALLLNIYKTYVQSKIDYGLSIWGCTTEVNLNRVQRIQNLLVRIICNNFDYIHSRGIDLVWVMTSPCMLIYMGMIQGALRICRGAPRRFIKEVFCIRVVHCGISCHRGSKNLRR